jgi:hypothetical protein
MLDGSHDRTIVRATHFKFSVVDFLALQFGAPLSGVIAPAMERSGWYLDAYRTYPDPSLFG